MKNFSLGLISLFLLASSFIIYTGKETFKVKASESEVHWYATKVTGKHDGVVSLKSGEIVVEKGALTGGSFVVDMTSIKVLDLEEGSNMNNKLTNHLKSPDFFDVEKHGEASFKVTSAKKTGQQATSDKALEYEVTGDLTIKGISNPLTFKVYVKTEGSDATARGTLVFDRSKYDVKYGSETFFGNLGDKAIYNDVTLKIELKASK